MASRIKGITIEINGDTTGLTKALSSVDSAIRNTQSELKDIDRLLKLDPGNTELLEQKQKNLASAIDNTKDRLEQLKSAQSNVEEGTSDWDKLQREIIETEQNLQKLESDYKEFGSVAKQQLQAVADKIKEAGEKMQEMGQKVQDVGNKISSVGQSMTMGVTTPIVGGFAAAVKTAGDFDGTMSKVKAISGATAEEMDKLRTSAMDMAEQTKFTASEMGDALSYMAMAGWDAEQMMDGLAGVANLAAASGEDLAMVSDIVTDGLTAFGLTAEDSAHFADVLAKTAASANTNVSMMGESFKYVGPVAGSMGYSIEDISVALGLMANSGIKADQAGTSLRNLIQRMAKPTKESETAINMLGLSLDDGAGNMLSFKDVLDQLRDSFGDLMMPEEEFLEAQDRLTEALDAGQLSEEDYEQALDTLIEKTYGAEAAEKAKYAAMLAGARAMPSLLAIVNASEEDYEKLTTAIEGSTGAAEEMANEMMDNLPGQVDIVKSKLEKLAITIGEDLMPTIMNIVDGIQSFIDKLNSMDESQRQTLINIAMIVAAVGPVVLIIGKIITGIGGLITAIGTISTAVGAIMPVIAGIGATITGTVIPAIAAVVAPVLPVIAIIGAVIAAIVLLWQNWDQVSAWIGAAWEKVTGFFSAAGEAISNGLSNLGSFISEKWTAIKEGVVSAASTIKEKASEKWSQLKENVSTGLSNLKSTVAEKWDSIKEKVSSNSETIKSKATTAFTNMKNSIATTVTGIKTKIIEGFQGAIEFITGLPAQALQWGKDIIQGIINGITEKFEALKQKAAEIAGAIKDFIGFSEPEKGPLSDFHTYMPDMIELMTKGITQGIPEVQRAMNQLTDTMVPPMQTAQDVGSNQTSMTNTVSINVYGAAGQNVNELANIIEQRIADNVVRRGAAFA